MKSLLSSGVSFSNLSVMVLRRPFGLLSSICCYTCMGSCLLLESGRAGNFNVESGRATGNFNMESGRATGNFNVESGRPYIFNAPVVCSLNLRCVIWASEVLLLQATSTGVSFPFSMKL